MSSEISGIIICGDLNVHHSRWLRFSNGNTIQGSDLRSVCDNLGLLQLTREPTRQQYLLDLVLSDVAGARAKVGPYIADHKMVLRYFPVPEIQSKRIVRYGFSIKKANWKELKRSLKEMDWQKLQKDTAEDALNYFMEILWALLCTHIPFEEINFVKTSHPWLNERCREAIQRKNASEGTAEFDENRHSCSKILAAEYQVHLGKLKKKISDLSKGSKQWWSLNRQLLEKRSRLSSIPPLRKDGKWISEAKDKANVFAEMFDAKAQLPCEVVDCPFFGCTDIDLDERVTLRTRSTLKILAKLDVTKATGPDRIPAVILREIAEFIAQPLTVICRRLLAEGCWPRLWKLHQICPLYKRDTAFKAGNYRGVHLTSILSKVAEKVIGAPLIKHLTTGKFGDDQWAFTPGLSARDLVTALVMSWILMICNGKKSGRIPWGYNRCIRSSLQRFHDGQTSDYWDQIHISEFLGCISATQTRSGHGRGGSL